VTLAELAAGPALDAVIIGGGINGCAVAEEASARGLRVALFEAGDFGFGTTWRSTKLIHGGLRYLEHGDVRLVFESLRERTWLLARRSHLVRPQRFVLPMLPWTRRPAWQLRTGLALYDMLSLYRGVPSHRRLSDGRLHDLMPALPDETSGGFTFFDARVLSPERLTLELALAARKHGAVVANHTAVTRILSEGGQVTAVEVASGKERHVIATRAVVNAAGPWVDAVNALGDIESPKLLGVTRGTHIVVELDGPPPRDAVFSTARADGRVLFAVAQGALLLLGTTDNRFDGDPGAIRPTREDVDYLLDEARALLPGLDITRERVRYSYAGLRPLQRVKGGPEAAITRRHAVIDHGDNGGANGLYSLVGGKLSTFRPLARDVAAKLRPGSRRASQLFADGPGTDWRSAVRASGLDRAAWPHLRVYGEAIEAVLASGRDEICPHAHAIAGEVIHAAGAELGVTLSDIILRRTGIGWASCRGLCCHRQVASLAAPILGWSQAARGRQVKAFEAEVAYHLPVVETLESEVEADEPAR
jgi:glycerol-3-phosphate dehydrogenase